MDSIFAFLALGGIVWYIYHLFQKKKNLMIEKTQFFQSFANSNNLSHNVHNQMTIAVNSVRGEINGIPYQLSERVEGFGKNIRAHTDSVYQKEKFDFEFSISKKVFFNSVTDTKGDIVFKTGNRDFDKAYRVHCSDENKMQLLLNNKMQKELLDLAPIFFGSLQYSDSKMTHSFMGSLN